MRREIETDSAEGTEAVGAELAAQLSGGDVVLLKGDLGAGKTTFVRGACRALGVHGPVTSPTFVIANRYPAFGGLTVAHIDLYRVGDGEPELLEDYIGPDSVAFVEWPGEAHEFAVRAQVAFAHQGGERRRIQLELYE